jgi:hypothetical protein
MNGLNQGLSLLVTVTLGFTFLVWVLIFILSIDKVLNFLGYFRKEK